MPGPSELDLLIDHLGAYGFDLSAWGLAWARVLPTVLIVPAFGLGLFPVSARLVLAAVFGAAVGYERRSADKPAGLRTLSLVAVGSALFTIIAALSPEKSRNLRSWDSQPITLRSMTSGVTS